MIVPTSATVEAPEEPLYEIVNGEYVEKPMSAYAVKLGFQVGYHMEKFGETHNAGQAVTEALFILDANKDLKRRPDAAYISFERWPADKPIPYEEDPWPVVPDAAAEVISPTNTMNDVVGKIREYFTAGVRLVWVVLPSERQVYVYDSPTKLRILECGDELDGGDVLPGFRLPLSKLFGSAKLPAAENV